MVVRVLTVSCVPPTTGKGIKDQTRNIQSNQVLLQDFFANAIVLLAKNGEIHVTIKSGEPYDSWNAVKIAKNEGLEVKDCIVFDPDLYPGYEHRRTLGFKEGLSSKHNKEIKRKLCKTYMFRLRVYDPEAKMAKAKHLAKQASLTPKQRYHQAKEGREDADDDE